MNARAATLFAVMSVLWGIPYVLIKVALEHGFSPVFFVWVRVLLAAVMLLAVAARGGALGQLRGNWKWLAAYAICELAIPWPLVAVGEQHIASSLAAIVVATVPLLVVGIGLLTGTGRRPSRRELAGLLVGLVGVVLLVGLDASASTSALLGTGAVFVSAIGYAGGPLILTRHLAHIDPRASMGASMLITAVVLTPVAAFTLPSHVPSVGGWGAVVALAVLCSAVAFVLMAQLIAAVGAAKAVVITYVNPVVALACGIAFLGESPRLGSFLGLALIIAGSWASAGSRGPQSDGELAVAEPAHA